MKIYLNTITQTKDCLISHLKDVCKKLNIEYKNTKFGFYAELFGTGTFYCLKTYINESGRFPVGTFDIYADTEDKISNKFAKRPDEIMVYSVGVDEAFEQEVKAFGIWYYTDGETYWIGPDYSEADAFESLLIKYGKNIDMKEEIAA